MLLFACANLSQAAKLIPPPPAEPPVPLPAGSFTAADLPNDGGGAVELRWTLSPFDSAAPGYLMTDDRRAEVKSYRIYRSDSAAGEFHQLIELSPGTVSYIDDGLENGRGYRYRIRAVAASGGSSEALEATAVPRAAWFNSDRVNMLIGLV
ncbi:MAG TPA: fibronectin type III domain-containing protein, partial [Candidatus Edwardsbacteria bacterium]|nr:fibronectin type III domain-containing protein [Candidatus Edwardsbacteria bacterium]